MEHIKVSRNKDEEVKFAARKTLHILDENPEKFNVVVVNNDILNIIEEKGLENTPDNQICACATTISDVLFITNDIACKTIAKWVFGLEVDSVKNNIDDEYKGFIEKTLPEPDMAYFYEHLTENIYDLLPNQYLIIKNENNEVVDKMKWDGEMYQNVKFTNIKTDFFGTIKHIRETFISSLYLIVYKQIK